MRLNKVLTFGFIIATVLFVGAVSVFAQYDTDIIEPRYEGGEEIFGIDTEGEKSISIYPEGCKSIERIVLNLTDSVDGELKIISNGEETPVEGNEIETVYEYCTFKFNGIEESDIENMTIDTKVRKSWLSTENLEEGNIALYTFEDGWKNRETVKESDNSIYVFYTSDEIGFTEYIGVGEYTGSSLPFGLNPWMLFLCCVLFLFVLLLISILFSLMNRNKRGGTQYDNSNY